jgi:hypothetical protein
MTKYGAMESHSHEPRGDDQQQSIDSPSTEPLGYQWPSSRLSSHDMKRLCIIRHAINKPITRLLQDAVDLLWEATEAERKAAQERVIAAQAEFRAKYEARLRGEALAIESQASKVAENSSASPKTTEAL